MNTVMFDFTIYDLNYMQTSKVPYISAYVICFHTHSQIHLLKILEIETDQRYLNAINNC